MQLQVQAVFLNIESPKQNIQTKSFFFFDHCHDLDLKGLYPCVVASMLLHSYFTYFIHIHTVCSTDPNAIQK